MKKIAVVAITSSGIKLGNKIASNCLNTIDKYTLSKLPEPNWNSKFASLAELTKQIFNNYRGIIFIMSTGIVVRMIAPLLKHKALDPAVVVMDENNNYAISLLSGHLGGANSLAQELANLTGCTPIITTATDINKLQAIDTLARQWGLPLEPIENIKIFNKALLDGQTITYWHEKDINLPENLINVKNIELFTKDAIGLHSFITYRIFQNTRENYIFLRPPIIVLGIGCRKNYPPKKLFDIVKKFFEYNKLSLKSVHSIATIELKAGEPALQYLKKQLAVPIKIYTKEQLENCITKNSGLCLSAFVQDRIGVGGVCEPAALLAADNDELLIKKTKMEGVTIAVAVKKSYCVSPQNNTWFN